MLKANRVKRAFGKALWLGATVFATGLFISSVKALPENVAPKQNTKARFSVDIDTILNVTIPELFEFEIRSDSILHYAEFGFDVSTNHVTGYTAYASVVNTDFINTADMDKRIPTIPNSAPNITEDFPLNRWGLSFPAQDPDLFLPATTNMIIENYDSPAQDRTVSAVIGTRINNETASGHYLCTIDFQVVPNVIPDTIRSIEFMQQMSAEVATSMQEDTSYQLRDNRDGKSYWVVKHDGQIFMEQNLDLEFTNDIEGGVPVYTVLRPASSDVTEERVMTMVEPWATSTSDIYYYRATEDLYFPEGYKTPIDTDDLSPYGDEFKFSAGSYYSWSSATAGTGGSVSAANTAAAESVCPKGWRLPTPSEGSLFTVNRPLVRSGHFDSTTGNVIGIYDGANPDSGALYLWTSSTGTTANDIKYFEITNNNISIEEGSRTDGFSVRCVANPPNEFTLTYDANGGSNVPAQYHRITWDESIEMTLPMGTEAPTLAGKNFLGWALTADANLPDFSNTEDLLTLIPGEPTTIYAVWRTPCNPSASNISEAVCMQDVNSTVAATMTAGTAYQLMDYRDGKNYFIAKINGVVWMTQNLDFEISKKGTLLTAAMTDVTADKTLTVDTESNIRYKDGGDIYFVGGLDTSADSTTLSDSDSSWHYHAGSYYSWEAAAAGSELEDGVATESICPKGWTLPKLITDPDSGSTLSGLLTDEHVAFNTASDSAITDENDAITFKADLDLTTLLDGPHYITFAGYSTEYGRVLLPGGAVRFWTSESVDGDHAKGLSLYHSSDLQLIQTLQNEYKNTQYSVRCVLK